MKQIITLAIASIALSASAMATTFTANCTAFPIQFAGATGSGTVSCPGFAGAPAGEALSGVALALVADYTFGTGASNDIKLTYTISNPAGVTWSTGSTFIDVLGGFSSSSTNPVLPVSVAATAGITPVNFASAFNVGVSSSVVSGGAGTSSAGVSITYTTTPTSSTPEPASLAMMGAALAGLAAFGRKRATR